MRADEVQIKRDKNHHADRAAVKENRIEDLAATLEQDKLANKNTEATQLKMELVLTTLLDAQKQYSKSQVEPNRRQEEAVIRAEEYQAAAEVREARRVEQELQLLPVLYQS